jgi:ribosomal protein S12 methylthiotransferase accessory factor
MIQPASVSSGIDSHPAIRLGSQEHRAAKEWVAGTHRAMDPVLTLNRIRPHLHKAGITRVADITGLDTIGIPVVIATRPASGTLAVEAGKGATLEAAAASATMEAIERFVGEEDDVRDLVATVGEVEGRLAAPLERFPRMTHAQVIAGREFPWSSMWDLRTGEQWLVPEILVRLPSEMPSMTATPWAGSSNGLASGNHVAEALCAGLYEVVERDATSCWQIAHANGEPYLMIDLESLHGEIIGGIVEQIRAADADVAIAWCPTEVGVPTCMAYVWSKDSGVGIYKGYGCHLDPQIAMIRAVTEAVQARTIFVAGARDDLGRAPFEALRRSDVVGSEQVLANSVVVSVDELPDRATGSFHGDVAVILDGLALAGFDTVLARELERGRDFEVAVVRVVIPGLEPYRFPWIEVTDRARSFIPPRS